ncbi:MAG: DUF4352 domain-containing protein [Gordonia sp. (in: high G+C Gram-positive bacteria)]|uniref:DUF4352 domain-containing protein n=1 Tax=Gordonia sp. (in: high G+C Gram-positive bacteria) TaxID=84139 RepID=UPI0039E42DC7
MTSSQQYPQQPYPQQPIPQQQVPPPQIPQQPTKKKKKWPWLLGGIIVFLLVVSALSSGSGDEPTNALGTGAPTEATKNDAEEKTAELNTPVRDGKFEFTVTGVEAGLSVVGDNPYLQEKAQGQFVVVTMTVKNISDEPQSFSPGDQKLKDSSGRTFETDSTAQIALGDSDIAVWDKINPGNTVTVKLVFDMPENARPASLELHDSLFSSGATVNLR